MKKVTFLLPFIGPIPHSGGARTILRIVNFLMKKYSISIEICPDKLKELSEDEEKKTIRNFKVRLLRYKEISKANIELLNIVTSENNTSSDIYIATGWQTFEKTKYYRKKNKRVAFFCQDLEWKFKVVKQRKIEELVKSFYDIEMPTFTMSKFLENYFKDQRFLKSTSLNVDTDIYYNQSHERDGVCLYYNPIKIHRLPKLVLKLAESLAKRYPKKTISLYGSTNIPDLELKNIKYLDTLSKEQLASLYNRSELGVIFSTSNPSRIAYEMVACGTPSIEADCEYTNYDMDSNAFIRIDPEYDTVISKIEGLLNNPKKMKRLRAECEIYSKNNFHELTEEKRFFNFINKLLIN